MGKCQLLILCILPWVFFTAFFLFMTKLDDYIPMWQAVLILVLGILGTCAGHIREVASIQIQKDPNGLKPKEFIQLLDDPNYRYLLVPRTVEWASLAGAATIAATAIQKAL